MSCRVCDQIKGVRAAIENYQRALEEQDAQRRAAHPSTIHLPELGRPASLTFSVEERIAHLEAHVLGDN